MAVRVLGVDACRDGWVAVELRDGGFAAAHLAAALGPLLAPLGELAAVGVDMPLGLPARGWRRADVEAARALGRQRASVFRVPPAPVWAAGSYPEAVAVCRELTGGAGFSIQAWGLRERLREANACWTAGHYPLFEVHPEVSFRALAGVDTLPSKKRWAGQVARRRALERAGIVVPDDIGEAGRAAPDDVLDAAAAAWTALRIARGEAGSHPPEPADRVDGRTVAIWY
jgi:predicted RNase H-like nuclease